MKILLSLVLLSSSTVVFAAPKPKVAPKVRWEYAFVSRDFSRQIYTGRVGSGVEYGSELRLPGRAPILLSREKEADTQTALLTIFTRLGNQGWELITAPTYRGPDQYIFKRRQ